MNTPAVWMNWSYAVIDVEGNGRRPPSLVELAVVPIDAGVIGPPQSWLVRPPEPITAIASRIHGIRNTDIAGRPVVAEVAEEITEAINGRVLVAHNAHVDLDVLTRELTGWSPGPVIDTLRVSRTVFAGQVPSHKLGTLAETFDLTAGMPAGLRPHRAEYDALVCARLLTHIATVPGGEAEITAALRGQGGDDAALF